MSAPFSGAGGGPLRSVLERLSLRQRQYVLLATILAGGLGLLWLVFLISEGPSRAGTTHSGDGPNVSSKQLGVMPAGAQVNPVDQWVGTAGRKLAQYESEREEQGRLNKDRQAFEARTLQRFTDLEQKLSATAATALPPSASAAASTRLPAPTWPPAPPFAVPLPPAASLPALPPPPGLPKPVWPPAPGRAAAPAFPGVSQADLAPPPAPPVPAITRVIVSERSRAPAIVPSGTGAAPMTSPGNEVRTSSTFLPVSFTGGILLGGLDAPTGGQAQSNPQPVLIRLSDNSILPNRFRGQYRDCFVVAAGYGDISAERAYLRTESLSCVRRDGATLEVRIQGSVYGEDGKVGMRGRLVTKQGQMLANALLAGVVSGIGQGVGTSSTEYSTSALGTVASNTGPDAYRAGIGSGVGRALDRLAQYYIKLAENTFPVIEVDAGRAVDVVITKGVRIDVPMAGTPTTNARNPASAAPINPSLEDSDDGTED